MRRFLLSVIADTTIASDRDVQAVRCRWARRVASTAIAAGGLIAFAVPAAAQGLAWGDDTDGRGKLAVEVLSVDEIGGLYPGFAGGDVHLSVRNAGDVPIAALEIRSARIASSAPDECGGENVTMVATTVERQIAPTATARLQLGDVAGMVGSAPDGCQGVAFAVELTVTAIAA